MEERDQKKTKKQRILIKEYFQGISIAKNEEEPVIKKKTKFKYAKSNSENTSLDSSRSSVENDHDYTYRPCTDTKKPNNKSECKSSDSVLNASNSSLENDHNYALNQSSLINLKEIHTEQQRITNEDVRRHNLELLNRLDAAATFIVNSHIERFSTLTSTFHAELFRKRYVLCEDESISKSKHLRKMIRFSRSKINT
jgi:hypothetical protein